MQTLFSEVLTKDDWLELWDNIFSNHPCFPIFFIVAYLIANRQTLLSADNIDDFKVIFHFTTFAFVFFIERQICSEEQSSEGKKV